MDRAQTNLFDPLEYTYSIFVTNLNWDEEDIYRFYDKRADVENHILKANMISSLIIILPTIFMPMQLIWN